MLVDLEKWVGLAATYGSNYLSAFTGILRHPIAWFRPDPDAADEGAANAGVTPDLFIFALISIFLGVTAGALIPGRKDGPGALESLVVVLLMWLAMSAFTHGVSRLMGGRGSYAEGLSASMQVLSVAYVLSNLLALLAAAVITLPPVAAALETGSTRGFVEQPMYAYFVIQTGLLTVYLPAALRSVHSLGNVRHAVLTAFIPALMVFASLALYLSVSIVTAS